MEETSLFTGNHECILLNPEPQLLPVLLIHSFHIGHKVNCGGSTALVSLVEISDHRLSTRTGRIICDTLPYD